MSVINLFHSPFELRFSRLISQRCFSSRLSRADATNNFDFILIPTGKSLEQVTKTESIKFQKFLSFLPFLAQLSLNSAQVGLNALIEASKENSLQWPTLE